MRYGKLIHHVSAALIAASVSSQAFAINELFLAKGPLGQLTKNDITIARAEIKKALDTGKDGQTFTWANPETKATGTIKPTKTFTKDGMRCRATDSHLGWRRTRCQHVEPVQHQGWLEGGALSHAAWN